MNEPTISELHAKSVRLGNRFASLYRTSNDHHAILEALEDYKEARRAIPEGDGHHLGLRRFGSYEAYKATQGDYLEKRRRRVVGAWSLGGEPLTPYKS